MDKSTRKQEKIILKILFEKTPSLKLYKNYLKEVGNYDDKSATNLTFEKFLLEGQEDLISEKDKNK